MLIRGLLGVIIGIAYGVLVSAVVFLLTRPDLMKPDSGLMIMLDSRALAWFGVMISGVIAGVCAAVVGLVVGLAKLDKIKAAIMGFATGLLVLSLFAISFGSPGPPNTLRQWIELLVSIAILPVGLALTGMVVSVAGAKWNRL